MKIIYIAGLGHSGSTILDMSLGCHSNIIGLGEVAQILKANKEELESHENYNNVFCSCGSKINECEFWKDGKKVLIQSNGLSHADKYKKLIYYVKQKYGNNTILIDSSKNPNNYLKELNKKHEVKIIFLVRDIRAWCYSRHSRLGTNILLLAYQWFENNFKILKFCQKNHFDYKFFGYEEIALYPEILLKKISEFIGIEYEPVMTWPDKSHSHIFNGNVAKGDKQKRKGFFYDARWLTSLSLIFFCPLIFPLFIFNRKLVYSNFMQGRTKAFGRTQQDFVIFGDAEKERLVKERWGIK